MKTKTHIYRKWTIKPTSDGNRWFLACGPNPQDSIREENAVQVPTLAKAKISIDTIERLAS